MVILFGLNPLPITSLFVPGFGKSVFGNGGTPGAIPASMETGCGLQQYPGPVFGQI